MKKTLTTLFAIFLAFSISAVAGEDHKKDKEHKASDKSTLEVDNTVVMPAGTYEVTAYRVDGAEQEIYAETEDGKILELYFNENTKLMRDNEAVEFSELKKGQKLEVKIDKEGDHNTPLEVMILEETDE